MPGFAMDQRDMTDRRIGEQPLFDLGRIARLVLGGFQGAESSAEHRADGRQALAIGAIDQYQNLAVAGHQRADGRLHGKGPAALQGHAMMALGAVDDGQQALADAGGESVETLVPRAPVQQQRLAGAGRGGERTGGEQDGSGGTHGHFLWR